VKHKSSEGEIRQYRITLDTIKKIYRYLPPLHKRPLTIPAIFGKSYDENFISDYLAYILHPQRNGIGINPLLALLNSIDVEIEVDDPEGVKIVREHYLDEYGRIDLLILIDETYAIGIENKIFSSEGVEQTQRYVKALEKNLEAYQRFFIYLTPTGNQPGSHKFKPVSYRQLLHILKAVQYDWAKNIRKSVIWNDFLLHLEFYITMSQNNLQLSEKTELYLSHHEIIEDIRRAYDQDARVIFEYILAKIKQTMGNTEWVYDFKDTRSYQVIWKEPTWKSNGIWVHYEFWYQLIFLTGTDFKFMVDVESTGRRSVKDQFMELFEAEYQQTLKNEYGQKKISYRPSHRRIAVAWKKYQFETDLVKIEEPFVSAISEFSFLTEVVDRILSRIG
jgi:hypothetical protein